MDEKKKDEVSGLTRRDFLRWVGIGSGTAAIAAGLPFTGAMIAPEWR